MKLWITTACVLGLAVYAAGDPATGAVSSIGGLSNIAERELAKSVDELNRLREAIEREKLPLAQKLTALEDRLAKLRKEHADAARAADEAALQNANLRTEMKARKDELAYVGNLLDEYARAYESRVHPCELQRVGAIVETAKQAPTNPTLSMVEKFGKQNELVHYSIKRLFDAVGGMRFTGEAVDLQSNVLTGQFSIIGPVALFCSSSGDGAGLVVPQTGSMKPLIRPLSGKIQEGLAALASVGEGWLPLDPSRGAALKALVQKTSLIHIFEKGGPIMWPLLVASILALATVLERVLFLFFERLRRRPKELSAFMKAVERGEVAKALEVGEKSKFFVVRSLAYAIRHSDELLSTSLAYGQARELKRFRRGIPILDTVITLAPLLGLLGTVTGMMGSFSLIGGELSAPGAITGGIAEALIATAFGLGIAIVSLIPFNFLNNKVEAARHEMETAGNQLELLMSPLKRKPAVSGNIGAGGDERPHLELVLPGMRRASSPVATAVVANDKE